MNRRDNCRQDKSNYKRTIQRGFAALLGLILISSMVSCKSSGGSGGSWKMSPVPPAPQSSAAVETPSAEESKPSIFTKMTSFWKSPSKKTPSPESAPDVTAATYVSSSEDASSEGVYSLPEPTGEALPDGEAVPEEPIYSDIPTTSASLPRNAANGLAYDSNAPITVKRLPPVGGMSSPESAPFNPAVGNRADEHSYEIPISAEPTGASSIELEGTVSAGTQFRGQSYASAPASAPYDDQIILDDPEDARFITAEQLGSAGFSQTPGAAIAAPMPAASNVNPVYIPNNTQSRPVPTAVQGQAVSGYPVPFGGPNGGPKSAWTPPGIQPENGGQWPQDEFIGDGGVGPYGVKVHDDFTISGLKPENTIVHFDTIDGKVGVAASNRVEIYSPKFRAVRQVISPGINQQVDRITDVASDRLMASQERNVGVMQSKQHRGVGEGIAAVPTEQFLAGVKGSEISNRRQLMQLDNSYRAYENLKVIKTGELDRSEGAMLAESARRAAVWNYTSQPQVLVDSQRVMAAVQNEGPGELFTLKKDTKNPQVRIIKIASVDSARSGDHVEFTIRFDNVGDEPVGNVTILDSLTGRLQYAENTAQCSKKGAFMVEPNTAGSLVLRWEIEEPLEPGEGGIIRFECIVR